MSLTIIVDNDVPLLVVRQRAPQERTSVNAVLERHLEAHAGVGRQSAALARFVELSCESDARSDGRRWTRDELHER